MKLQWTQRLQLQVKIIGFRFQGRCSWNDCYTIILFVSMWGALSFVMAKVIDTCQVSGGMFRHGSIGVEWRKGNEETRLSPAPCVFLNTQALPREIVSTYFVSHFYTFWLDRFVLWGVYYKCMLLILLTSAVMFADRTAMVGSCTH